MKNIVNHLDSGKLFLLEGENTALCEHKEQAHRDKQQKKLNVLSEENSCSRNDSRSQTVELLFEHIAAVSAVHKSDARAFGIIRWKFFSSRIEVCHNISPFQIHAEQTIFIFSTNVQHFCSVSYYRTNVSLCQGVLTKNLFDLFFCPIYGTACENRNQF